MFYNFYQTRSKWCSFFFFNLPYYFPTFASIASFHHPFQKIIFLQEIDSYFILIFNKSDVTYPFISRLNLPWIICICKHPGLWFIPIMCRSRQEGRMKERTVGHIYCNNNGIIAENNSTKFPGNTIVQECSEAYNDADGRTISQVLSPF